LIIIMLSLIRRASALEHVVVPGAQPRTVDRTGGSAPPVHIGPTL